MRGSPHGIFAHDVPGRKAAPRVDAAPSRSVSYTHLRAHETVLDLVCRLLLEKKKAKYTNHNDIYTHHEYRNRILYSTHSN